MDELGAAGVGGKALLRSRIRAERRQQPAAERAVAGALMAGHAPDLPLPARLDGCFVTCFMSLPTEPDTAALIESLRARGASLLVPRVAGQHLDWVELAPSTHMTSGPFGIREPLGDSVGRDGAPLAECLALFLPALAIDERGYRLGQGGGFYDRALADLPSHRNGGPIRIAVVFADEVLDRVPIDEHDCRVDLALTEAGIRRFDG